MVKPFHHARYFFFLFSAMGIVSPYMGWWLQQVLDPLLASTVLACFYATIIVVPSLWGHAAFTSNKPGHWLSKGTLLASLFALGLTQVHNNTPVVASCFIMVAFGIFYNPLMSLLDAIAYAQVEDTHTYSRIRLYGSLGFLIFSSIVGGVLVLSHPHLFPYVVSLAMLVAYIASLPYQKVQRVDYQWGSNIWEIFFRLMCRLKGLWVVVVLSQVSFVIYYTYVAAHLSLLGFSNITIGCLVGLATLAEIAAFWKIRWFFARFSPWMLIGIASFVTVLRWVAIGASTSSALFFVILFVVQLFHALSFTVFHTACLKIIHESVPLQEMGLAQGVYNALGYGVGGVLGVIIGGWVWSVSHAYVFYVAALVSLSMALFAFRMSRHRPSLVPS